MIVLVDIYLHLFKLSVERIIFDDDDDVIILPQEEPIIIEIPDDDDALGIFTSSPNETNATYEPIENESDLQILVPRIPVVYVEDFKEKPIDTATDVEKSLKSSVKIRDEPKADGYEDDGFEDIGTFEDATIIEDNRGKEVFSLMSYNFAGFKLVLCGGLVVKTFSP